MIYYFSGTGNSKWVAEEIAKQTGDEAVSIPDVIKTNKEPIVIKGGQSLGLVFPVHAWAPSKLVMDFIKNIVVEKGAFCFAVCTCGDEAGLTMKKLSLKFPLNSAYSIVMPNSYIIGYDVDSKDVSSKKLENAKNKISQICEQIVQRKNVWDVKVGKMAFLKSNLAAYAFNRFGKDAKSFSVENTCTSCGICAKVCPTENIKLKEGHPVWSDNCLMCLACINRCPVKAIQYGKSTQEKGRYYFGMK
ncbi:MAG: EFR1 family ferrodoxin [Proteocatella sp.]